MHGRRSRIVDEFTRFLHTAPGGPTVYLDSDGTMDVNLTDRTSRPWFLHRMREGVRPVTLPAGTTATDCRHSGQMKPLPLAAGDYLAYPPWHLRVLEADVLLGRRGILGYDGKTFDLGLEIGAAIEADDLSAWDSFLLNSYENPW